MFSKPIFCQIRHKNSARSRFEIMNVLVINCCPVKNGATAEIVDYISRYAEKKNIVKTVCVDDYDIHLCKGCRYCHKTASCVQSDDTTKLMEQFD